MKLSNKRKVIGWLGAITLVSGGFISQAQALEQTEEFSTVESMSVSEFEAEIESKANILTYIEIQVATTVPGEVQTFGTLGDSLSLDQVVSESLISIEDMLSANSTLNSKSSAAEKAKLNAIQGKLKAKNFRIGLAKGKSKTKLLKTRANSGRPEKMVLSSGTNTATALAATATTCGIWRPNFHANIAAPSSFQGQRYDQLKFAFTQGQLDQFACTGSTGFEPDLVTYNYDGYHYFGDSVISFSSNMPFSYLDTNLLDDPNERVYTVGSYKRTALSPWVEYTNYIRTYMGNTDTDLGKVVWQRKTMNDACYVVFGAAYCSFPDESKPEYAWKFPLPGTYQAP